MSAKVAIKVSNLSKNYKLYTKHSDRVKESLNIFRKKYHTNFNAVKNISFEVKKGETVGIIGRNGCGKSTLLKMISNVLTPSSGRVTVHGHISAILELGAGFNPEMTGLENIYLNTSINGLSKKQTDQIMDQIVKFSELDEFIQQPIKTYSSGMKARLAFSVAINVKPDILIIDEALSVGDAAFQRKCFSKMEELRSNGVTILFVSHSEGSITNLCNRAIWLSNGEQILDGHPKLVTGLYLKYSNSKQINKEMILIEYQKLVKKEKDADKQSDKKTKTSKFISDKKEKRKNIKDLYDPTLKPTSTIYYEERGGRIDDIMITTLDGEQVNILIQGSEYIYQYTVYVDKTLRNVQFGFLINTKNGVAIGGGVHPGKDSYLEKLKKTSIVKIKFKCELNNGEYFLNAGLLANTNGKHDYVHRILDAYMFKVIEANNQVTAIVNFITYISVKEK